MNDVPIMTAEEACEKFAGFPLVQKAGGLDKASFVAGYEMAVSQIRAALNPLEEKATGKLMRDEFERYLKNMDEPEPRLLLNQAD